MIAGDIVPPGCYLSAVEILRRQYTAHLVDPAAQGELTTADGETLMPAPRLASVLFGPTGWVHDLSDAALTHGARLVEEFLGLFPAAPEGGDDSGVCAHAAGEVRGYAVEGIARTPADGGGLDGSARGTAPPSRGHGPGRSTRTWPPTCALACWRSVARTCSPGWTSATSTSCHCGRCGRPNPATASG